MLVEVHYERMPKGVRGMKPEARVSLFIGGIVIMIASAIVGIYLSSFFTALPIFIVGWVSAFVSVATIKDRSQLRCRCHGRRLLR